MSEEMSAAEVRQLLAKPKAKPTKYLSEPTTVETTEGLKMLERDSWDENEFLKRVIALARSLGWRTAHFRTSKSQRGRWLTAVQGDGKGFPDLILARGPGYAIRLVVAELKVKKNKPTVEQYAWLGVFESIAPTFVWYPKDWDRIVEVLSSEVENGFASR